MQFYMLDWSDYSSIQCGNSVWMFMPVESTWWFLDEHGDENAPS
jgi:hypothetical protein